MWGSNYIPNFIFLTTEYWVGVRLWINLSSLIYVLIDSWQSEGVAICVEIWGRQEFGTRFKQHIQVIFYRFFYWNCSWIIVLMLCVVFSSLLLFWWNFELPLSDVWSLLESMFYEILRFSVVLNICRVP